MANANSKAVIVPAGVLVSLIMALVAIGVAYGRDNGAIQSVSEKVAMLEIDAKGDRARLAVMHGQVMSRLSTIENDVKWIKRNGGRQND